ncbi:hypothetical protein BDN72DRAFT_827758 [Pluteus cervinus]|uniref:Uncharacterized protein n=1 Tax=Pluteus cervinus TaxID=181527 RepID=A0ACD3A910_9AGAR|nr:hypothetical protein BDN72DRAFT_827758 [Pluteus cervinus]
MSFGMSIQMRYQSLRWSAHLPSDAVSYAIDQELYDQALVWADQGRSIIWGQVLQLRLPLAELHRVEPRLAERLVQLTSDLDGAQTTKFEVASGSDILPDNFLQHLNNATEWTGLIEEVRRVPGFNRFLRPKTSAEILSAINALGGPVIYLNANRYSSDALAIVPGLDEVLHIPLHDLDFQLLKAVQILFRRSLSGTRGREEITLDRIGKLVKDPGDAIAPHLQLSFPNVLRFLWERVVKPVLDGLAISSSADLPRIWWCPSGPLSSLPLHAAGRYEQFGDNILDYVISSYASTASIALHATRPESHQGFRLLAVANPKGCGLPGTERELEIIRNHATEYEMAEIVGEDATVEAVRREMEKASWVHFACHGVQDTGDPTESALILANRTRLTLLEITKLSLPKAQFAFLSACQTAKGTDKTPDEFAHLASGMLVAGYRSVIGTMWQISDEYAPFVADRVYKRLLETPQPDYRRSAYALNEAVRALRKEPGVGFRHWVPFIHFGV